jgi:flagellar basal-body rod protein FlgB
MKLFDATTARLERAMDVRLVRHNVLASNVANVDTPGYAPKDLDFRAAFAEIAAAGGATGPTTGMRETDARHIGGAGEGGAGLVRVVDVAGESPTLDGNRVDLDATMAHLAENGIQYGASARAVSKKLAILRYVASDGNG